MNQTGILYEADEIIFQNQQRGYRLTEIKSVSTAVWPKQKTRDYRPYSDVCLCAPQFSLISSQNKAEESGVGGAIVYTVSSV